MLPNAFSVYWASGRANVEIDLPLSTCHVPAAVNRTLSWLEM